MCHAGVAAPWSRRLFQRRFSHEEGRLVYSCHSVTPSQLRRHCLSPKYCALGWIFKFWASQVMVGVKNPLASAGYARDVGLIPGSGRSPGGGQGNALQYSCLGNPMDRGVWWAQCMGDTQSDTTTHTSTF